MIRAHYVDDNRRTITYELADWEALEQVAQSLVNAPIDLDYLHFIDGTNVRTLNLNTFEVC